MKAYFVTHPGFVGLQIVTAAKTADAARYHNYLSALDAGYRVKLIDYRSRRAPEYDGIASQQNKTITLGWRDRDEAYGCLQ